MYRETFQSETTPIEAERGLDFLDVMLIFARRRVLLLLFTLAGALAVFLWSLTEPKLYRADAVIMPPQEQQSSSALLGQLSVLSSLSGMGGGGKNPSDLYIGLLKSRTVGEKLVHDFNLLKVYGTDKVPAAQGLLAHRTKILADKDGLIIVTVEDTDAHRAKDLANAYGQGLFALNNTLAIGQASQRRLFFDKQLEQEKDKLADAEVALQQVEEKTGVIQLNGQTSVAITRVSQLQADIMSRVITLAALRSSSTEENPEVIRTESELAGLRQQLTAMQGKPGANVADTLGIPTAHVPELSLLYIRKERDVQYHQTLFDLLARQLEAARIDEAKAAPIVQVVDYAETPDRTTYPRIGLFTALGAFGGFILGCIRCVMLYLYDYIDEDPRLHPKMWAVKSALRGHTP